MIIPLRSRLLGTLSDLTRELGRDRLHQHISVLKRPPIWSCSWWGLPCPHCRQWSGELLPRRFTLAGKTVLSAFLRRSVLCGTFLRVTPTGRYPAPCPAEFGLSSLYPLIPPLAKGGWRIKGDHLFYLVRICQNLLIYSLIG